MAEAIKPKSFGFGMKALRRFPELIPVTAALGVACVGAAFYIGYMCTCKSDVYIRRGNKIPPWERIDPTRKQKFMAINQKYERNEELEKLRSEIGSYKV